MSSWFHCDCGHQIHKNLFAGANVRLLIPEDLLDSDFTGSSAEQLVAMLVMKARLALTCSSCGRLHIVDETGQNEPQTYVRQSPNAAH